MLLPVLMLEFFPWHVTFKASDSFKSVKSTEPSRLKNIKLAKSLKATFHIIDIRFTSLVIIQVVSLNWGYLSFQIGLGVLAVHLGSNLSISLQF